MRGGSRYRAGRPGWRRKCENMLRFDVRTLFHRMSVCPICKGEGWVCEQHRFVPWKGGTMECCDGPAVPCDCNPRGRMPPGFKVHCSVNDEGEEAEQKARQE